MHRGKQQRGRTGWALTASITVATYALALTGWSMVARSFPDRTERPAQSRGVTRWVAEGEVPLTVEGRLEGAHTLAIGDSRTWMAIDRATLDASPLGPSCVLWGSGGDLRVLLDEAAKLDPELLIVGLSPHSMGPDINEIFTEVTRERFPVFRAGEATTGEVRAWRREEQKHLVEAGYPENLLVIFLDRLQTQFLREQALLHDPRAQVEAWLDSRVQRLRFDHVYTLKPSRWRHSWLCKNDPTRDVLAYRRRLESDHFQDGKEAFRQQIIERLRTVAARVPTVLVRFPLSPEVRAVEDEAAPPDWMAEIAETVGVPYVDYGTVGVTADGSHVTTDTAAWLTADLVERLSQMDPQTVDSMPEEAEEVRQGALASYRFDAPDREWSLPDELQEISGLVVLASGRVACIQDERGELFVLDLEDPPSTSGVKFGAQGDYEALARAENRLFVMRSDGVLQELEFDGTALGESIEVGADLPFEEYESLCHEPSRARLLFAPKDAPAKGGGGKHKRPIYAIDLETMRASASPALELSVKDLIQEAAAQDWPLPMKTTKKGKRKVDFQCRISDMAVHPITGEIYLLDGTDPTLLVVDPEGQLKGTATFPEAMLPQPEGLAFRANGDLLLSSEGEREGEAGRLLLFKRR